MVTEAESGLKSDLIKVWEPCPDEKMIVMIEKNVKIYSISTHIQINLRRTIYW